MNLWRCCCVLGTEASASFGVAVQREASGHDDRIGSFGPLAFLNFKTFVCFSWKPRTEFKGSRRSIGLKPDTVKPFRTRDVESLHPLPALHFFWNLGICDVIKGADGFSWLVSTPPRKAFTDGLMTCCFCFSLLLPLTLQPLLDGKSRFCLYLLWRFH